MKKETKRLIKEFGEMKKVRSKPMTKREGAIHQAGFDLGKTFGVDEGRAEIINEFKILFGLTNPNEPH